jgi:hypothetical protein
MRNGKFIVELEAGEVLPLERAKGVRLTSAEGTLWITEERGSLDVVLQAGQSHEVGNSGKTLVQAMGRARVAIASTSALPQLAFAEFRAAA